MPAWLVPIAGEVAKWGAILVAILLAVWFFKRSIEKRKDAQFDAADAKLRAEAAKASQEGYVKEREKQKQVDPITGRPLPPRRVQ